MKHNIIIACVSTLDSLLGLDINMFPLNLGNMIRVIIAWIKLISKIASDGNWPNQTMLQI